MEWVNIIVTAIVALAGAFGGGSLIYWRATKKSKTAEADKTTAEARLAEADLAEKILQKYEQGILARMDSGDAVRKKELKLLAEKIDGRFDGMEKENSRQNILLSDIVEYLNGDFQKFENSRHKHECI